jgi:subtilisin family serine protease
VRFAADAAPEAIAAALDAVGATAEEIRPAGPEEGPLLAVAPDPALDPAEALAILSLQPGVEMAEPDFVVSIAATSNDPSYVKGSLWGMLGDQTAVKNAFGSQAGEAWAANKLGAMSAVVGVVDSGMDYRHQDLYLNVWLNQREIPLTFKAKLADTDKDGLITFRDLNAAANSSFVSDINRNGRIDAGDLLNDRRWENGLDEDGNGRRDDLVGWDFANNDNDPFDDNGHGTHVSGTIGAAGGNGTGVAGVAWNVQMMALKFIGANGSGSTSAAIAAVDYFTDAAKRAAPAENFVGTNNSWGGGGASTALSDAIARAAKQDLLFVAAAGNGGADGIGDNNDVTGNWPSNYSTTAAAGFDAVISVAALTGTGARAGFSNYGKVSVDLAAPGQGILSTLPGDAYGTFSGTSMAAPHVMGAAALYAAANPTASAAQIRAAILDSAAATPSMAGITATGDRLDVGTLMATPAAVAPATKATIARIVDDAGAARGNIAAGGVTDDRTPTLHGTLSATLASGETVAVYRNGAKVGDATVSGTAWSFAEKADLAAGALSYAARVEKAGLAGTMSSSFSFTLSFGPVATTGNDSLAGTAGNDTLSGVPAGTNLGRGSVDKLTGLAGADLFVLGDARGVFYDDGVATNAGRADYAQIMDFQAGDKIQLSKAAGAYLLASATVGGVAGIGVFADLNRNLRFDAADELIGHVARVTSLSAGDFVFA